MALHKNAALTVRQREQIQLAVATKRSSYRQLAQRYGVSLPTIQRWARRATGQERRAGVGRRPTRTPAYEAAVLAYRHQHPDHGPIRIAHELRPHVAQAHRGTILAILQAHGLTRPAGPKKAPATASGPPPGPDGRAVLAQTASGAGL